MDDRLREDGAAAAAADPRPPDPLGGGQQGGRLPAGTGQPRRHLGTHASADTVNEKFATKKKVGVGGGGRTS